MSEKDALREEVRQEREQLVAAVRTLRADIAGLRRKLAIVTGLRLAAGIGKAIRGRR